MVDKVITTLTSLCCGTQPPGPLSGTCVLCGEEGTGNKPKFSSSFTGYNSLFRGEIMCGTCQAFMARRDLRMSCWVATAADPVKTVKFKEARPVLTEPPEPPFAIYLTRSYKRQGWLGQIRQGVNYSADRFRVITDWVGCVKMTTAQNAEMLLIVERLRKIKTRKAELLSGDYGVARWKKIMETGLEADAVKACALAKTPAWEVCVHVSE